MKDEVNPYMLSLSAATLKALDRFGSGKGLNQSPTSKPELLPLRGATMTDKPDSNPKPRPFRISNAPDPISPLGGSSYIPPKKPPEPLGIDWRYWRHMPEVKQWEACALSLNINPDNMEHDPLGWMDGSGSGSGPVFLAVSFPSMDVQLEFEKRLRLLGANLFKSPHFTAANNLVWGSRHLATVNLREFAAWGLHVEWKDMPPELVAMADPAPEQNAATTAPVSDAVEPASDARPDPERRLALLRELGGAEKYTRGEWKFTGIKALVDSENANGRKRSTEKTIRVDLKEAARNERDANRAGFSDGLGQR